MHNASSVRVPVLCFGLVTSTPVFRRLVCSTPLSSPAFSPLETPKAPKGGDGGRKGGGFKNAGALRTSTANPPAFPPLQSADSGARRRPWAPDLCSRSSPRTSTSSQGQSVSLSVLSYPSPMISFRDYPARVLLCSSRGGSGSGVMQPRGSGRFGVRHCWNADALRRS